VKRSSARFVLPRADLSIPAEHFAGHKTR